MKFEDIRQSLTDDQKDGNGEILYEDDSGIAYYDYETSGGDDYLYFKKPEICTKEKLQSLIFVGHNVNKKITPELIANILCDAYGESLPDMMIVLRGIVIVNDDDDISEYSKHSGIEEIEIQDEMYITEDYCGRSWFRKQTTFIYEQAIIDTAKECVDEFTTFDEEYLRGIGSTVIHECRHIMLDCNPFLDEKQYPVNLSSEDAVEDFCRDCWDKIGNKYY